MPVATRRERPGLIFAGAAHPKGQGFVYFPLWGRSSDYSSDEKVSFLREAATKQAPGNPRAGGISPAGSPQGGEGALPKACACGLPRAGPSEVRTLRTMSVQPPSQCTAV